MNSPLSFFGKCFTILLGIVLSWATVTIPEFDSLASQLLGGGGADASLNLGAVAVLPLATISPESAQQQSQVEMRPTSVRSVDASLGGTESRLHETSDQRIEKISVRLKQLGASYLLLEKLPQARGVQYRARCDLADQHTSVKCCFEATRDTALAAMEEVLRSAQLNAGKGATSSSPAVAASI